MKYKESEVLELKRELTSENAIRQMIVQSDGTSYESMLSFNQELHFEYAKIYFQKQGLAFEKNNMKTMSIINNDGLFTNLALLMADECQHTLKIAVFADITSNEFLDRKEFSGSVLKQLSDAFDYLKLNNKKHGTYDGLSRIDSNDYDDLVLREALLNAIIHRDYSFSGSIIIKIYSDRFEFVSMGGLVHGINIDDLMIGISQSRNEKLANIFYRLELVESYGTGIKKIFDSYQKSIYSPELKITNGAFLLILPNRNVRVALEEPEVKIEEKFTEEINKEINHVSDEEYDHEKANGILKLLTEHGKLSRKELQGNLDMKQTSCIMLLNKLEAARLIKKMGKGKNIKYQKY